MIICLPYSISTNSLVTIQNNYIAYKVRAKDSCSGNTFGMFRLWRNRGCRCPFYFLCPFVLQWGNEETK